MIAPRPAGPIQQRESILQAISEAERVGRMAFSRRTLAFGGAFNRD